LSGSDPTKSYFSFDADEIFTNEEIGTVKVNVTRYGSLAHDVSVYYNTVDLTANAGEDYVAVQNRLVWSAENADVKTVKIMILKNEGVAEGEESFFLQLSSPTEYYSALGKTFKTTIRIGEKPCPYPARILTPHSHRPPPSQPQNPRTWEPPTPN
jgi:hypothetical protein